MNEQENEKNEKIDVRIIIGAVILLFCVAGFIILTQTNLVENYIENQKIKGTIRFLMLNDIQIWGIDSCVYCQKQLEVFGDYQDYVKEIGLYIRCEDNIELCRSILPEEGGTPFFTMEGEYLTSGYRNLNGLRDVYKYRK